MVRLLAILARRCGGALCQSLVLLALVGMVLSVAHAHPDDHHADGATCGIEHALDDQGEADTTVCDDCHCPAAQDPLAAAELRLDRGDAHRPPAAQAELIPEGATVAPEPPPILRS